MSNLGYSAHRKLFDNPAKSSINRSTRSAGFREDMEEHKTSSNKQFLDLEHQKFHEQNEQLDELHDVIKGIKYTGQDIGTQGDQHNIIIDKLEGNVSTYRLL